MKRFTDTNKWLDPWFRKLTGPAKMLWFYLVDHCDNIGLCELDLTLASRDCDTKITEAHITELGDRVQRICNGKVYITKFIPFQYGTLSEDCKPHKKLLEAIRFHSLKPNFKGYEYPIAKGMDTLQEKEKEKDTETDSESRAKDEPENPPAKKPDDFDQFWTAYPRKVQKGDAIKAWAKMKPDLAEVLKALEWQKRSPDWTKDDGQFIPYPASYLHGMRWTDEKPATQPQQRKFPSCL